MRQKDDNPQEERQTESKRSIEVKRRILAAAVEIFSDVGYNGARTRDIAKLARVNDVTMFRSFGTKHELFLSALESEMSKLHLDGRLIHNLAHSQTPREALAVISRVIDRYLAQDPRLARFFQFAVLELKEDFESAFGKHIEPLVNVISTYLGPWIENGNLPPRDPQAIVFSLATVAISNQMLTSLAGKPVGTITQSLKDYSDFLLFLSTVKTR